MSTAKQKKDEMKQRVIEWLNNPETQEKSNRLLNELIEACKIPDSYWDARVPTNSGDGVLRKEQCFNCGEWVAINAINRRHNFNCRHKKQNA